MRGVTAASTAAASTANPSSARVGTAHRHAARERDAGFVGDVARLRDDHLVAGVEQHPQREVQPFRHTGGDQALVLPGVAGAVPGGEVGADQLAQARQARVGRVGGVAVLQRVDPRLPHAPRGDEVRLADAEGDHVVPLGRDVEELPDARRRAGGDHVVERLHHAIDPTSPSPPARHVDTDGCFGPASGSHMCPGCGARGGPTRPGRQRWPRPRPRPHRGAQSASGRRALGAAERCVRVPALAGVVRIAGAHHERCDGSGYFRGSRSSELPVAARVVAAADVYAALVADRPHRAAFTPAAAMAQLREEVAAGRLDRQAVDAVLAAAGHAVQPAADPAPDGLTPREVEVLRLVARGADEPADRPHAGGLRAHGRPPRRAHPHPHRRLHPRRRRALRGAARAAGPAALTRSVPMVRSASSAPR